MPRGGPDGGDGGTGGSVFLEADPNVNTLLAFRYRRYFKAEAGYRGDRRLRQGRDGSDIVVPVPVGTQVWTEGERKGLVADLDEPGERWLAAAGGRGGAGNAHYATSTNQFPRLAQAGIMGQERTLRLELKLLADVGIIGAPNAGKSSLISVVSAARPKVADYAFTTLEPSLGVVEHRDETFVMVDIPGLIEGAHTGVGLGHEFLRHVERTRVLIHLVDGSVNDPVGIYRAINQELVQYDRRLARKPQLLVINKLDLTDVSVLRDDISEAFGLAFDGISLHFISAVTHEGVEDLLDRVVAMLRDAPDATIGTTTVEGGEIPVVRPEPKRRRPEVHLDEDSAFVVDWLPAERMARMVDPEDWTARIQFYNRLERAGVIKALEEAGAGPGDLVRIGDAEWVWE